MKLISHRGNIWGRVPTQENKPDYIDSAISLGYDVEIDLWYFAGEWFLGHDSPDYQITSEFIRTRQKNLWIHCKNIQAIKALYRRDNHILSPHFFYHTEEKVVQTNFGYLWYHSSNPNLQGIIVMPDEVGKDYIKKFHKDIVGVCDDNIIQYKIYE